MKTRRGFSIAEVLISAAIMGIILSVVAVEFAAISSHAKKTTGDLDAERAARLTMSNVTREMRQAMVDIRATLAPGVQPQPCTIPQFPIAQPGPSATPAPAATAASTVQCTEAEPFVSSNPDPTANNLVYDTFSITLSTPPPGALGGQLVMTTTTPSGTQTQRILGNDVSSFSVLPISKDVYDISITVPDPTNPVNPSYTINSSIFLSYFQENT